MTARAPWKPNSRIPYERFKRWYDEVYLPSDYWKELRERVVVNQGYRCRRCGSTVDCVVHHRTYERLCREELEDLEVLCRRCHDTLHTARRLGLAEAHPQVTSEVERRQRDRAEALAYKAEAKCRWDADETSHTSDVSLPELAFENMGWDVPTDALEPEEPGVQDQYPSLS
jgi:hypothetical protein